MGSIPPNLFPMPVVAPAVLVVAPQWWCPVYQGWVMDVEEEGGALTRVYLGHTPCAASTPPPTTATTGAPSNVDTCCCEWSREREKTVLLRATYIFPGRSILF